MLKWKIGKNVIEKLYYNNLNIINPWGFETADSSSFFSLEDGVGWRYKILKEEYQHDYKDNQAILKVRMKEGLWRLFVVDMLDHNSVHRKISAEILEDSIFMDFVMRFRFKKELIEYAVIDNKKYYHSNTNIYYQYPVDKVQLKGRFFDINITVIDSNINVKFEPVIYVRDNTNEWVVHVRMVPKKWDKEVIKICTAWAGTRPLPQWLTRFLLNNNEIRKSLWYRGERKPFKNNFVRRFLNPAAFGLISVKKGEELMWNVDMEIVE